MNRHQLNKERAKLNAKPAVVAKAPEVKEVKPNAVKEFIKAITPDVPANGIKPSDFLPKKKKPEVK